MRHETGEKADETKLHVIEAYEKRVSLLILFTAQKMKFSIKDFLSKRGSLLWSWLHLLTKFLIGNFIFCAVILSL